MLWQLLQRFKNYPSANWWHNSSDFLSALIGQTGESASFFFNSACWLNRKIQPSFRMTSLVLRVCYWQNPQVTIKELKTEKTSNAVTTSDDWYTAIYYNFVLGKLPGVMSLFIQTQRRTMLDKGVKGLQRTALERRWALHQKPNYSMQYQCLWYLHLLLLSDLANHMKWLYIL